jgi:bifunctional N-acetylglucosamine-1-phosphate-uridyltransferase/glucosamine-1-phosphate-acetyltransferase GlmU-like protein
MKKTSIILIHSLPDKKIKSLGNKALIQLNGCNLLDYQIGFIKKLFSNSEIIVVGGFDSKKLGKYIHKKYTNIKYVSHEITDNTNIGFSVQKAIMQITGDNILIINGNLFIDKISINDIKKHKKYNFILSSKQSKSNIGLIVNTKLVEHCFFDLPKPFYDFVYIHNSYMDTFCDIIKNNDFEKYYLFEIINECINKDIYFYAADIDSRNINIIDNNETINKIIRKQKKYA